MESTIQVSRRTGLSPVEAQLRECFGRVVYTHKTQEKCSDICLRRLSRIKVAQIVLSAISTGGIVTTLLSDSKAAGILAAICSTVLLALNTYTKDNDLGQLAQQHKDAAHKLWDLRESYLSLLTDIRSGVAAEEQVRTRRDQLQGALSSVYAAAPHTSGDAYASASVALKEREELTFSDAEIDQFLPKPLRVDANS